MANSKDSYFAENAKEVLSAFDELDLAAILADSSRLDYPSMSLALLSAATQEEGNDKQPHGRVLRLLSEICSLRLSTEKMHDPFPSLARPSDFTPSELDFIAAIIDSVEYPLLKGRLVDLLWQYKSPRNVAFAQSAIDNYVELPLDADTWFLVGSRCWQRAIHLCRLIGKASGDRLHRIESSIVRALMSSKIERGFHGHMLAETLILNNLAQNQSVEIATRLESMAREFDDAEKFHSAAGYFSAAAKWFDLSNDTMKFVDMKIEEAELHEKEAAARTASDDPNHVVAAEDLTKAVFVYQSIPKKYRSSYQIEQRIQRLNMLIREYGHKALDEMATFSTPGVDVSHLAREARKSVDDKPVLEALMFFVNLHRVDAKELRKTVIEDLSQYVFPRAFGRVYRSRDGRVVERIGPYRETATPEDNADAIRAIMNQFHYGFSVKVAVTAQILPALDILNANHQLSEADFIDLVGRSPIVPKDRTVLWGKALAHGFHQDFMSAIHLLCPQIEHMVRIRLKSAGVNTIARDRNGIEMEKGLSTLVDLPETKDILGEDLAYEIKTIFCDQIGPNLKNDSSHGLLSDQDCLSSDVVYAWWLGLKLVVNSIMESFSQRSAEQEQTTK